MQEDKERLTLNEAIQILGEEASGIVTFNEKHEKAIKIVMVKEKCKQN